MCIPNFHHLSVLRILFLSLTYCMVQSPWEANWFAASQEIPRISRNPKVHYRTQKRLPPGQASRMYVFLNISVLQGGVFGTSPNPQAGGPLLIGSPRLIIQFIHSYPPYRRPFLYPQPGDAPCRGDRDFIFSPFSLTILTPCISPSYCFSSSLPFLSALDYVSEHIA